MQRGYERLLTVASLYCIPPDYHAQTDSEADSGQTVAVRHFFNSRSSRSSNKSVQTDVSK